MAFICRWASACSSDGLHAIAAEIGLSRIYAGVHYRFDIAAGDALGEAVAGLALARDVRGHAEFVTR